MSRTLGLGRVRRAIVVLLGAVLMVAGVPAAKALTASAPATKPVVPKPDVFGDFYPAFPGDLVVKQPDGSTFKGQLTNAEVGANVEVDGYTVTKRADGWWVYATGRGVDGSMQESNARVGADPRPAGVEQGAGRTRNMWLGADGADARLQMFRQLQAASWQAQAQATAAGEPRLFRFPVLMLSTWWDEEAGQTSPQFQEGNTAEKFKAMLDGFGGNAKGSLTEFYFENSFGQFLVQVDVFGPFTSQRSRQDRCYYGGIETTPVNDGDLDPIDSQLGVGGGGAVGMAVEAVPQADATVDFSQYDNDGDGFVDFTALLHSGPDMAATGDPCHTWSHAFQISLASGIVEPMLGLEHNTLHHGVPTTDGVMVDRVFTMPEVDLEIGVATHEMAHALGEPDYYNPSYTSQGTGDWDIMAGGSWFGNPPGSNPTGFNPTSKVFQGWMKPRIVHDDLRSVSLDPRSLTPPGYTADQENPNVLLVPTQWVKVGQTDQYDHEWTEEDVYGLVEDGDRGFVVEGYYVENWSRVVNAPSIHPEMTRAPYFDRQALGSGLMVWHFDYVRRSNVYFGANNAGSDPNRPQMDPVEWDYNDNTQELQIGTTRGEPQDLVWGAATGITSGTRLLPPGIPEVEGASQDDQEYSGVLVPLTTSDHPFTVDDNPANFQLDVTLTGSGDCTLELLRVVGGEERTMGSVDAGFVGETEQISVSEPEPGDYIARVGDFAVCGQYAGEINFSSPADVFNTKGSGDTWSNWSAEPTGWAFTNVGPAAVAGLSHSAESTGSEAITLDVLNIGDGETDVSPGFVRAQHNSAGGTVPISAQRGSTLEVPVFNNGGDTARDVTVEVRRGSPSGTLVANHTVTIPPYQRFDVKFPFRVQNEGPVDLYVVVDRANTVFEESNTNNVQKSTVWVGPPSPRVLVVDDDGAADSEDLYAGALASLKIPYAIARGHVDAGTMNAFEAVIWEAGLERYQGQMDAIDRAEVKAYLDGGGKLLFTSPRAAAALGEPPGRTNPLGSADMPPFLAQYFGVEWGDTLQIGGGKVTGLGDILGTAEFQTDVFPGRPLQDVFVQTDWLDAADDPIPATGTVTPVASWEKGGEGSLMGVRLDADEAHGGFQTAYLGFNLSQLVSTDDVATVLGGVLDHFGVEPGGYTAPRRSLVFHSQVRNRISGTDTPVKAFAFGTDTSDSSVLFRRHGQGGFWSAPLTRGSHRGALTGVIPANAITPDGVDYYLQVGSAFEPRAAGSGALTHTIGVALPEVGTPIGIK